MGNLFCCGILLAVEHIIAKMGAIKSRREIWYLWDYGFFKADLTLVSVMDFCIGIVLWLTSPLSLWAVAISALAGVLWTFYWHTQKWLPRTAGFDSAYPAKGKVSVMGRLHLLYFCFQYSFGMLGAWEAISGLLSGRWGVIIFFATVALTMAFYYFLILKEDVWRFSSGPVDPEILALMSDRWRMRK